MDNGYVELNCTNCNGAGTLIDLHGNKDGCKTCSGLGVVSYKPKEIKSYEKEQPNNPRLE